MVKYRIIKRYEYSGSVYVIQKRILFIIWYDYHFQYKKLNKAKDKLYELLHKGNYEVIVTTM